MDKVSSTEASYWHASLITRTIPYSLLISKALTSNLLRDSTPSARLSSTFPLGSRVNRENVRWLTFSPVESSSSVLVLMHAAVSTWPRKACVASVSRHSRYREEAATSQTKPNQTRRKKTKELENRNMTKEKREVRDSSKADSREIWRRVVVAEEGVGWRSFFFFFFFI